MDYEFFQVAQGDGIARVRMNRPEKRNAMSPSFWQELPALVRELDDAGETRVMVLSGAGPHFSAGMDLSVFSGAEVGRLETPRERASFAELVTWLQSVFSSLEKARFPVIAAIQGACIGGAVDMAAACDIRLASTDAYFRIEEINIGMMADLGTLQRLPKLIPEGVVRELAYTGETLGAARAEALGFVNSVHEGEGALMARADELAERIAAKPPLAVAASKQMITYARDHAVPEALEYVAAYQAAVFNPADLMRSFQAKMTKKPATFEALLPKKRSLG